MDSDMETSPGSAPQAHESKEQGLESSPISDANTQNDIVQEPVIPPKKSFRFKVTIFMLCLVASVVALDSVIVAACLPAIAISLNGGSVEVFWVGTSYLLAQTIVVPLYGTFSDIFGRKSVILFAICLFLLGSILCGCAQNMSWLIGARVAQGLGGGGILTLAGVIVSDMTTLRERGKWLACIAFAWSFGTNVGVPVGGAIGEFTSWRWIFWINIPICVIGILGLSFALHLHQEVSSLRSKLARIDYLGIAIFIAATTLLLYGCTTGGTTSPWKSANVLVPLILGFVGLGIFVLVEWKVVKFAMVPMRLFLDGSSSASYFGAFVQGLVLWCFAYYMIIFFLGARGDALFKSSAETLPGSAPVAASAVFAGVWVAKTLHFQKITLIAWILVTVGTGLHALMKPNSGPGILYGMRVIAAVGGGFLFQVPIITVQAHLAEKDDMGMASALTVFFRSMGQAFGVAIGGTVFQNEFDRFVAQAISKGTFGKEFVVTGAEAVGAYGLIGNFPEAVTAAYRFVYADALRTVWYVMTGIAGMGLLASLVIKDANMDKGHQSSQGFKERGVEKSSV